MHVCFLVRLTPSVIYRRQAQRSKEDAVHGKSHDGATYLELRLLGMRSLESKSGIIRRHMRTSRILSIFPRGTRTKRKSEITSKWSRPGKLFESINSLPNRNSKVPYDIEYVSVVYLSFL